MAGSAENPPPAEQPIKPLTGRRAQIVDNLDRKASAYFKRGEIAESFPKMIDDLERREPGRPLKALYLGENDEGERKVVGTRRVGYALEGQRNNVLVFENTLILVTKGDCPAPDEEGRMLSFSSSPVPIEIPVWERNKKTDVQEVAEYFGSNMDVKFSSARKGDANAARKEFREAVIFALEIKKLREASMYRAATGSLDDYEYIKELFDKEPLPDLKSPPRFFPPSQDPPVK